jgi:hypothetical protein
MTELCNRAWNGILCCMKPLVYVRALTPEERRRLTAGLRSSDALTLQRCQILLAVPGGSAHR